MKKKSFKWKKLNNIDEMFDKTLKVYESVWKITQFKESMQILEITKESIFFEFVINI